MSAYNATLLRQDLNRDEGRKYVPYKDTAKPPNLTVGVGHNLNAGPLPGQHYPMTDAQIDALLDKDIASSVSKLDTYMLWWLSLPEAAQRVLIELCFNMGIGRPGAGNGLLAFHGFLTLMQKREFKLAADDLATTLWARQVGARAGRIEALLRSL